MDTMAAIPPSSVAVVETPILDQQAAQLERFDTWLNMLEATIVGVLLPNEEPDNRTVPQEIPQGRLHSQVLELARLIDRAEQLRARIRL